MVLVIEMSHRSSLCLWDMGGGGVPNRLKMPADTDLLVTLVCLAILVRYTCLVG